MLKLLKPSLEYQSAERSGFSAVEIVVISALILILGAGFYLYFHSQPTSELAQTPPVQKKAARLQKRTPSLLATQPPLDQSVYTRYQFAGQKFSFEYPQTWTQIELKNLESVLPKEIIDKNELTMPFIASDPRGAQIVLSVYHFDKSMELDAIMVSLEKDAASLG